jgi:hypothetical protein
MLPKIKHNNNTRRTPDPAHKKALEMVIDFAKPGSYPRVTKLIAPVTIDPRKHSGIRLFYKSDTETGMSVSLRTGVTDPDGRYEAYAIWLTGKPEWAEITIPFGNFKSFQQKVWKDGTQNIFPCGQTIPP